MAPTQASQVANHLSNSPELWSISIKSDDYISKKYNAKEELLNYIQQHKFSEYEEPKILFICSVIIVVFSITGIIRENKNT